MHPYKWTAPPHVMGICKKGRVVLGYEHGGCKCSSSVKAAHRSLQPFKCAGTFACLGHWSELGNCCEWETILLEVGTVIKKLHVE